MTAHWREACPEAAASSAKPATSTTPGRPPRHLTISTRVAACVCDCTCERTIRNAAGERESRALAGRNSKSQHPWSSAASCKRRKATSATALGNCSLRCSTAGIHARVVGDSDPGQHARARPRAHGLLDCPQSALQARRGMNHQQAIDVDAVLLQSRGIRDERRSYPSDPLLGLGRIFFRQCRQCRHQQPELADPVTVDENLGNGS